MKKGITYTLIGLITLLLLTILFAVYFGPGLAVDYLNKNSEDLVGRKAHVESLDITFFPGTVQIVDFTIYDQDTVDIFVHFDTMYVEIAFGKIMKGEIKAEAFHLDGLNTSIEVENGVFNFDDLIPEPDTTEVDTTDDDSFIKKYTINDIQITRGTLSYENHDNQASHHLEGIHLSLPGISFGSEHTEAGLGFDLTEGGSIKIDIDYNTVHNSYMCDLELEGLKLSPYLAYIQPHANISECSGTVKSNLHIEGKMDSITTPLISGSMNLDSLNIKDKNENPLFALDNLHIDLDKIDLKNQLIHFGLIKITAPEIHFSQNKTTNNFSSIAVESNEKPDTASTPSEPMDFLVKSLIVENGTFHIQDSSPPNGTFSYLIDQLNFETKNLTPTATIHSTTTARLNKKGNLKLEAKVDLENYARNSNFDITLSNLPIKDFSVYCEQSTGYPIEAGRMTIQTTNDISNYQLKSQIDLNIYKTIIGDKNKDVDPPNSVPLKLGVTIMEDGSGKIHMNMPAEGNLKDPDFKYTQLIWKTIMNVIFKAAASPFNLLSNVVGAKEDDIKYVDYEILQSELRVAQVTQLDLIADLLQKKPELKATAYFQVPESKEEKLVKIYVAKRDYYKAKIQKAREAGQTFTPAKQWEIYDLPVDQKMLRFLEKETDTKKGTLTFEQLVDKYVTTEQAEITFKGLMNQRIEIIRKFMSSKGVLEQFTIEEKRKIDPARMKPRLVINYH